MTWPARPTASVEPAHVKSERQLARERVRRRAAMRSRLLASASTVVFVVVVGAIVVSSPGWERVRQTFFSPTNFAASFPSILGGFWLNVRIFLVAEPIILVLSLLIAVVRSLTAPVLFPLRALATLYVDIFRGVPTILVIFLVGFGIPALRIHGLPSSPVILGTTALVLSYCAYVAEVYRAGIESVHASQWAAARSLGLTIAQAQRHVILPQAVRRVVPPLLNNFVSLQLDTALVSVVGPLEALRQAQIYASLKFNYTSYLAAAILFILLTVPVARLTDHVARRVARRQGPGVAA
ncbi:MAG: amino acid ABC transporter permease [Acidimicrobiales bacterium]